MNNIGRSLGERITNRKKNKLDSIAIRMEDTKEFNKDSGQHSEEVNNGRRNDDINLEELDQPN